MAVTQSQQLYNPQVESLMGKYATAVGDRAAKAFTPQQLQGVAPTVAGQTGLQKEATRLAGTGLGAYQQYVTDAGTQLGAAQTGLGGVETGLGQLAGAYAAPATAGIQQAQGTLGGVGQYIGAAGTGLGQAGTALAGAQTQMGGAQQYIGQAAGLTGTGVPLPSGVQAGSIEAYMSPYQQQVIGTTLQEFDKQAAMRQQAISDAAVGLGGFGGGREGVMQSEYQLGSDKNRAALEAQLQQQGFTQAQAARQADMASRLGIGGAQQQYAQGLAGLAGQRAGLAGQAGQFAGARAGLAGQEAALAQGQLGLGGALQSLAQQQGALAQGYLAPGQMMAGVAGRQAGMAGQRAALAQQELAGAGALQGFQGTDIARAGQVGAMDQSYIQAQADAQREFERMKVYEPYERLGFLGSGLTGLMGGMGPQYQFSQQANLTPLQTALGIGSTMGGIFGDLGKWNKQ